MLGCKGSSGMGMRYKLTLATGLLECLCFAGVVFGWASLVFVLKTDGYFSDLCINVTDARGELGSDCSLQDENFSSVFTVASFMNNFLTLPNGFVYDHFGTMATRFLAIFLYTTGTLIVAFSNKVLSFLLFPALSFIAVGGILFLMTNMQVGNLFVTHRSTIITVYNGAFDSSSVIFLIIKVLYEKGVSLRSSFLFLSTCNLIHLLRTLFLMPTSHIPYPIPENYKYGMSCAKSNSYNVEEYEAKQDPNSDRGRGADDEPLESDSLQQTHNSEKDSFRSCVLSWFFLWHLIWLSVMQLRHYFFIGTLNPMLNRLANQDPVIVSEYTNAFAFTQLCGVLCAPWNGLLMDRHKRKPLGPGVSEREADLHSSVLSLLLTSLQCLLFSISASIPFLPLQYVTFILQVLNRSFIYGGNAAFISIAFPARHFGKLYGLVMSLSAVVSLLQYPCFALNKVLGGDPFYVNIILTVLTLLAFIHPVCVFLHCRELAKHRENSQSILEVSIHDISMY
ncbi:solute carrier family 43 member 3a isoform X2 [Pimephales promelas]|uniref:solute carrier family 43 member 3a isoform X2 n=1 Tax=Pimephales promelas TaxID=90988 RepID=UPI001955587C|nr:solute carrier family 43 member 3a isoform X2 [Pimephales promelas]KAG1956377.1 large neutral amino acids transporter small subunit [Pimephales promelas]KAG1956378.1 large neutral amino acids transporter small subunit [Pimephales promelas]